MAMCGCLFEAGKNSPYEGIVYREVDVRDIIDIV